MMNILDLIIIGAMVFFIVRGIWRGFLKEMGSLAGVILGIWLAMKFQPQLTLFLKSHLSTGKFISLISFAGIFLVVLVGCNLAGWGLKTLANKAFLGWADKMLGAALAVLKGIILTYLVIILLTFFLPAKAPLIATSRLAPMIVSSYQSLAGLVLPRVSDHWKKKPLGRSGKTDNTIQESAHPQIYFGHERVFDPEMRSFAQSQEHQGIARRRT